MIFQADGFSGMKGGGVSLINQLHANLDDKGPVKLRIRDFRAQLKITVTLSRGESVSLNLPRLTNVWSHLIIHTIFDAETIFNVDAFV